MKIYNQQKDGSFSIDGLTIPDDMGNRHRRQLQAELDAVPPLATVNLYVAPPHLPPVVLSLQEEVEALREAIETSGSATLKAKLRTNRETKLLSKGV